VNQTRAHCVNQMGKTHSKPLAARHGRGTAWAWHAMCESALKADSHIACRVRPCLIHKNVKCESDTAALCESNGKDTF
jgi:hypothetical protein